MNNQDKQRERHESGCCGCSGERVDVIDSQSEASSQNDDWVYINLAVPLPAIVGASTLEGYNPGIPMICTCCISAQVMAPCPSLCAGNDHARQ